jgi:diadenosine tetraphosphatase ApaH/serine/threonine PP2A family protein phosphatase
MRTAVIADLHSNLEALTAVIEHAHGQGADRVVCLGDIVGHGPEPGPVIELLRGNGYPCVRGNHDDMAVGRLDTTRCSPSAARSIVWTRTVLTDADSAFLDALPFEAFLDEETLLIHSAVDSNTVYLHRQDAIARAFRDAQRRHPQVRVVFFGHTHRHGLHEIGEEGVESRYRLGRKLRLRRGRRYMVNAGSVGQSRDPDPRACYALFDDAEAWVRFFRVEYAWDVTLQKLRQAGLDTRLWRGTAPGLLGRVRRRIRRVLGG